MSGIFRSTGIIAASTLASRVLGLLRDMLMAAFFSATGATDAFYAAFRIPNLIRRLVGEGVFTISFIPVYTEYLVAKDLRGAFDLARRTLTMLLIAMTALVFLGMVFAPDVVGVIAMGFNDRSRVGDTIVMFRIMLPFLVTAACLAFCTGVLNSHRYFFAPAFAPVLLNAGIITGILLLSMLFDEPLYGVSAGVLMGGLLQVLFQIPYMARTGFRLKLSFKMGDPGLKRIFRFGLLGIPAMGSQQINILVATVLASFLAPGSISYIYFSDRLHELVLGLTVMSLGSAVYPAMSEAASMKNYERLFEIYSLSVRSALFMAIPATVGLMAAGYPVVSVLFMHDRFTAYEALMTYRALFCASTGIVAIAVVRITVPVFFALGNPRAPFFVSLFSFAVNAACGYYLMRTSLLHAGLTLSVSIAVTVEMIILAILLRKKIDGIRIKGIAASACRQAAAAGIMGLLVWYLAGLVDWNGAPLINRVIYLLLIVGSGAAVYLFACLAMRSPEVRYLIDKFRGRNRFNPGSRP
jgi:putative peptidoglycan lipid II flippase